MGNKHRVFLEVFSRGRNSLGAANREQLGFSIYHWAIMIAPKGMTEDTPCSFFDATDAFRTELDGTDLNPNMDWWFRARHDLSQLDTGPFLGGVMIGKLPQGTKLQQVEAVLKQVPLPRKGHKPVENCASWVRTAIEALQAKGYVESSDVGSMMEAAFKLGDSIMSDGLGDSWQHRFRNGTDRPM